MAGRALKNAVYIVGGKRTAYGSYGGTLKDWSATKMQLHASKAAVAQAGLEATDIESVVVGNCIQSDPACPYVSRHVALQMGCEQKTPALTINRLCGSGFQSVVNIADEIDLGMTNCGLAGGTESMSGAPMALYGSRFGMKLGQDGKLVDTLWAGLTDMNIKLPMGITAENLAEKYGISREEADALAQRTQQRWGKAQEAGIFNDEIAPIEIKKKGKMVSFEIDEHARPSVTLEQLAKLPSVFKKGGAVSAGNASGVCDGAGAIVLANDAKINEKNIKPLARVVAYSYIGCDPLIMGIGPVPAINKVLEVSGISKEQVGIWDINEAFAPQFLACEKELQLDPSKTNVCGGAIALGHPLASSGSRIMAHLAHALQRTGEHYAIGSACIGGGQGIAILLEKC
jgi:acetyl-CoA acyltransferase 2